MNYSSLFNVMLDQKVRYVSSSSTIVNWFKNADKVNFNIYKINEVAKGFKTSDTVFILGGSEAINEITDEQWKHIKKHDSIGINWWPIHKFVPTYYYTNYPRDKFAFDKFIEILSPRIKEEYADTLFFVSGNRAVRRGIHPRVTPCLFPDEAHCCFYDYPDPIKKGKNTPFSKDDFSHGNLLYRGALSVVLDLINRIGNYQRIVLLGIDFVNRMHFYDTWTQMQWQYENGYRENQDYLSSVKHRGMQNIKNKHNIDEYIFALCEFYYKPRNISLYAGSEYSVLRKFLPLYSNM